MKVGGLPNRYAKALVEIDKGKLSIEELSAQVAAFAEIYSQNRDFRQLLENPAFSLEERKAVLGVVCKKLKAATVTQNFLFLLCDKERTQLLPDISKALQHHTDAQSGVVRAVVNSATELSKKQLAELVKGLTELKGKPVKVTAEVQPGLLGGIVVEMDGSVYDGSIKKRLDTIRESILRETR